MKKIILHFFFLFSILYFIIFNLNTSVFAADFNIDCTNSGCTKTGIDSIFSNSLDGVWYPGRTLTKTLNLKNSSSTSKELGIKPTRTSTLNILEDVIQISILTNPGGLIIWAGSITDFYNQNHINMGTFASGVNQNYNLIASMNSSADSNYQGQKTIFDLTLGFWEESDVTTPVCNDSTPGSAPSLLSAIGGTNNVTLSWSEATDPVTYYLVAYGISPSNNSYSNPNVGGKGTISYTISGLSGGTTYCFIIRAGNGCKPGAFSNQICSIPGGIFIPEGTAPGFTPGVLGISTPSAKLSPAPPDILGIENIDSCKSCILWQILLGELVALISFYYFLRKINEKNLPVGLLIPILTYIIFLFVNKSCFDRFKLILIIPSTNFFCRYFLIITITLYAIVTLFWRHKKEEVIK